MSCEDCSAVQDVAFNKNIDGTVPIAYIRIENANVAIVGCEKHVKIIINSLRNKSSKEVTK